MPLGHCTVLEGEVYAANLSYDARGHPLSCGEGPCVPYGNGVKAKSGSKEDQGSLEGKNEEISQGTAHALFLVVWRALQSFRAAEVTFFSPTNFL